MADMMPKHNDFARIDCKEGVCNRCHKHPCNDDDNENIDDLFAYTIKKEESWDSYDLESMTCPEIHALLIEESKYYGEWIALRI